MDVSKARLHSIPARLESWGWSSPEWFVGIVSLLIGTFFALLVPAGAGLDEPFHVSRAIQIAEGDFFPVEVGPDGLDASLVTCQGEGLYGGETDVAIQELVVAGNLSYYQHEGDLIPYSFPAWTDERMFVDKGVGEDSVTWVFSNTAINSPLCYLPHSIAYLVGNALTDDPWVLVAAMRLAGVLAYTAGCFCCVRLLPVGKWVFAFVALMPHSLGVNSMVTADMMTFVCVSLYLTFFLRMLYNETVQKIDWVGLSVSTSAMCLVKVTYAPLGLLLLLLPILKPAFRSRWRLGAVFAIGVTAIVLFAAWYSVIRSINTGLMWGTNIDPVAQQELVASNPLHFLKLSAILLLRADFLVLSFASPFALWGANWITVLGMIAALVAEFAWLQEHPTHRKGCRILGWCLIFICLLVAVLVCLALYLQFSPVGSEEVTGVQTRYFIPTVFPFLMGLLLVCGLGNVVGDADQAVEVARREVRRPYIAARCVLGVVCLACAASYFIMAY